MNKQTSHHTSSIPTPMPLTVRQMRPINSTALPKKFTPASRNARIDSWHQRMQGLFARQSY